MVFDPVTAVPHVLKPPVQDRLRKDHGCGRAVSYLVGLHGDLSHYTCAEVLNLVSEEYLDDAVKALKKGADKIADLVKSTLGPSGHIGCR